MLRIFNTATGKKEEFHPQTDNKVGMYTCGMTVYDYAHIGHGRKYVGDDIVRRALQYFDYQVNHVQNVTDVGHLVSDDDEGQDKMEKGAAKHGKTVWEVAEYFTDHFYHSMQALNILRPTVVCKATEHINEQIYLIQSLIEKGFAYDTPEAVYFDIEQFPSYGVMFGQKLEDKKTAVRQEVHTGEHKKHPYDFVLWFKRVGRFEHHVMYWSSPWGDGFPGWHIECSAMSMKYIGETLDIHTGGIDHIPVHHINEIAQSEAATGKRFARYWIHHAFLTVDGTKMSKSLGNYYTIEDVIEKGYDPIALRFFYLSAHYRQQLNFTWEALQAAQAGYKTLCNLVRSVIVKKDASSLEPIGAVAQDCIAAARQQWVDAISDDLNMPQAVAVVFEYLKRIKDESGLSGADYAALYSEILAFDNVLGLKLDHIQLHKDIIVPQVITDLVALREMAREQKNWKESDRLRDEIIQHGFAVEDTPNGPAVRTI